MTNRRSLLVRHPLPDVAYQALRYCRTNGARVDVFYVDGVPGGPFSAPTALRRSARQHGWRCAYRIWCADRGDELSIDHLAPLTRGGTDRLHNLRIACADCNERKGDMKLQSFRLLVRQRVYERLHGVCRCRPAVVRPRRRPALGWIGAVSAWWNLRSRSRGSIKPYRQRAGDPSVSRQRLRGRSRQSVWQVPSGSDWVHSGGAQGDDRWPI